MCAIVSTAGWCASIRRVSTICSAPTMAAAAGTGSSASCGADACPPRPVTVTRRTSAAAISGPGPGLQLAGGHGRGDVQRVRGVRAAVLVQQPFFDHVAGAVEALLAGLEHQQHPARDVVAVVGEHARRRGEHRDVRVVPARVHRAGDLATRTAARCPRAGGGRPCRRAAARSGPAGPLQHRDDRRHRPPEVHLQGQVGERGEHGVAGDGQVEAQLRAAVHARRSATVRGCTVRACARSPARSASSRGTARSWHRSWHFGVWRAGQLRVVVWTTVERRPTVGAMAVQSVEAPADVRDTALPGFAVAAIREEGRWRCARMAPEALVDLDAAITELRGRCAPPARCSACSTSTTSSSCSCGPRRAGCR